MVVYFVILVTLWRITCIDKSLENGPNVLVNFHSSAINPKHQLLSVIEVNLSITRENFVSKLDKSYDREFIKNS